MRIQDQLMHESRTSFVDLRNDTSSGPPSPGRLDETELVSMQDNMMMRE